MSDGPTEIANQALDQIGSEVSLGDITDGSREASVLLRAYRQCRKQLLRSAHWDFARKEVPLTLLADASGQTANVGTIVPGPFLYSYAYPTDAVKARAVPWIPSLGFTTPVPAGNIALPQTPVMPGLGVGLGLNGRTRSARFIVTTDVNSPPVPGQALGAVQGVSPQGRSAVLTDVPNAWLVYTFDALYAENWDALFRAALVSYIASEVALAIHKDKRLGMALRSQQIAITKAKIDQARIADGNEGISTTDHRAEWMTRRNAGVSTWLGCGVGFSDFGYGWDACGFADGTTF